MTRSLDLALLDLIICDRAHAVNAGRDFDLRHVTDTDDIDHTVAHVRIKEVATVAATRICTDTVVEIMEETADVAAGLRHVLLLTLALSRLGRTMWRPGHRRGTTVDNLRPEREHHVTQAGQECPETSKRATLVRCLITIYTYM